jgi:hypothetical protein
MSAFFCQVRHFDEQQEKDVRLAKYVHSAINTSASAAAGTLAGKP